jgi:hypothetical protein
LNKNLNDDEVQNIDIYDPENLPEDLDFDAIDMGEYYEMMQKVDKNVDRQRKKKKKKKI